MTFSEQLQEIKNASGMTNPEMAKKLEVPLRTFENWKSGVRTPPSYIQSAVIERLKEKE